METLAMQTLAKETLAMEALAKETLAMETLAIETLAMETLAMETLAMEALATILVGFTCRQRIGEGGLVAAPPTRWSRNAGLRMARLQVRLGFASWTTVRAMR